MRWTGWFNSAPTCRTTTPSGQIEGEESSVSEHTSGATPGIHVQHVGTIESVSVSATGADRLKPNAIGLMGVIFVAVTGAAPISAMLFNVPISVGYGNGIGTPAGFLVAAVVLTIFSVSYVAMAKHIRAAGGFYSFISHGLGRDAGLITGICGGDRVQPVRGVAARRIRVLRERQLQRLVRLGHLLAAVRVRRGAHHQHPLLVRRRAVGARARCRADRRDHHPHALRHPRDRPGRRLGRPRVELAQPGRRRSTTRTGSGRAGRRSSARRASASSSRSGRGSASRPPRTTPRSRGIRSGTCRVRR